MFASVLALLGIPLLVMVVSFGLNLFYQFWIHTELVGRLPRPIEAVFNTPSHHRVHHGSNPRYLDRNYGGILIVWDRWFGSFEPESEPVRFGLTKNITRYDPLYVAFHEWVAVFRDAWRADSWRLAFRYLLAPPGWRPDASSQTAQELRQAAAAAGEAQPA